jgi:hypothetical protein
MPQRDVWINSKIRSPELVRGNFLHIYSSNMENRPIILQILCKFMRWQLKYYHYIIFDNRHSNVCSSRVRDILRALESWGKILTRGEEGETSVMTLAIGRNTLPPPFPPFQSPPPHLTKWSFQRSYRSRRTNCISQQRTACTETRLLQYILRRFCP